MYKAVIKLLNPKGYGFLKVEGRDKDLFFHATECSDGDFKDLSVEQEVVFDEIGSSSKGEVAIGVRVA